MRLWPATPYIYFSAAHALLVASPKLYASTYRCHECARNNDKNIHETPASYHANEPPHLSTFLLRGLQYGSQAIAHNGSQSVKLPLR
jgi:hypothetical protein